MSTNAKTIQNIGIDNGTEMPSAAVQILHLATMKFKRLSEIDLDEPGLVCRQAHSIFGGLVFVGLLLFPVALALRPLIPKYAEAGERVELIRSVAGMMCGALALITIPAIIRCIRLARRPTNWLLRIGRDHLWINTRPYDDLSSSDDPSVIELEYHEIADVRCDEQGFLVPRVHKRLDVTKVVESLVVRLRETPPAGLAATIESNRRHVQPRRSFFGITWQTGVPRSPVLLASQAEIRLVWQHWPISDVWPRLPRVMRELERSIAIGEPTEETVGDLDDRVARLVELGDEFRARDVLVRHGGMTLTDANRFVEELKRKT